MSTTTTNYGLVKPQTTDNADLTVFVGQNMDSIDSLLEQRVQKDATYGTNTNATNSAFRMYASGTTNETMAAGAINKISFDTIEFDILGEADATTNYRFTAKTAGVYIFSACFRLGSTTGTQCFMSFYKNGTEYTRVQNFMNGSGNATATAAVVQAAGATVIKLAAGDYIEVYGYSSVASSVQGKSAMSSGAQPTFFAGVKIA